VGFGHVDQLQYPTSSALYPVEQLHLQPSPVPGLVTHDADLKTTNRMSYKPRCVRGCQVITCAVNCVAQSTRRMLHMGGEHSPQLHSMLCGTSCSSLFNLVYLLLLLLLLLAAGTLRVLRAAWLQRVSRLGPARRCATRAPSRLARQAYSWATVHRCMAFGHHGHTWQTSYAVQPVGLAAD
jgi:hypothetical protein